jgi:DNA-binding response OmpR family regulator
MFVHPVDSLSKEGIMDILLVEDHDGIATTLGLVLRRLGHDVRRVARGLDALTALPANLILLDLGLPDIDGFEVLARLRATDANTPVIIMTARTEPGVRERALAAGADGFIAKPFTIDELVMAIDPASIQGARLRMGDGAQSPIADRAAA